MTLDLAIIGAGPYGLSIAAHVAPTGLSFRIFGKPMVSWRQHMPKGMHLKSEGFASNLYDPDDSFTLRHFCEENALPYADVGLPVALENFAAYGLEFQRRFVPKLEETDITSLQKTAEGFELKTAAGQSLLARRVIVATGLTHFESVPAVLAGLPDGAVSHSSDHHDLENFAGKRVAVIGAGASALDIAALLHEAGASVELVARARKIGFHNFIAEPRPLLQRLRNPRSGLGIGWRSLLATDAPLLFHKMPEEFRLRVVRTHLGPAPGWFIRKRTEGKFPFHLGAEVESASADGAAVRLGLLQEGKKSGLVADHVIAATGYTVSMKKLNFIDPGLLTGVRTVEDTPVLSSNFQTSVPGLYVVGVASSNSFGPLARFAYGAGFTANRLSRHLAAVAKSSKPAHLPTESVGLAAD